MVKNKKIALIAAGVLIVILLSFTLLYLCSRVYWKYDDQWIIGRSRHEIETRYGKFDSSVISNDNKEVYFIKDSPYALIDNGEKGYYVMIFNKSGKCIKVYRYNPPGM